MNSSPQFSIIIPTYNSSATLDVALSSIIKQTYSNIEVVIIDGLSTDTTLEIAKRYQKDFPNIIIKSEKDKGIYDAMNKGIVLATGDWLYFMGSDDSLFDSSILKTIFNLLETVDTDIIYGQVESEVLGGVYGGKFIFKDFEYRNICHQSIFFRKKMFLKMENYSLKYPILSDWHHNIKWFSSRKIKHVYTDEIISNYGSYGKSSLLIDDKFENDKLNILIFYGYKIFSYSKMISLCTDIIRNYDELNNNKLRMFYFTCLRFILRKLRKYNIYLYPNNK